MEVFISWSGERSRLLAEALRGWLRFVLNNVHPWMSGVDIFAGARSATEIGKALERINFGLLCVTRENFGAPWLLFEAGALAKLPDSPVIPVTLDDEPGKLPRPLLDLQGVKADEPGIFRVVSRLNSLLAVGHGYNDKDLSEAFAIWWPKLNAQIQAIPATQAEPLPVPKMEDSLATVSSRLDDLTRAVSVLTEHIHHSSPLPPPNFSHAGLGGYGYGRSRNEAVIRSKALQQLEREGLHGISGNSALKDSSLDTVRRIADDAEFAKAFATTFVNSVTTVPPSA